ncbi:MAG: hypothetical protein IH617_14895, partial [Hydrogenophaga sp.]|nr:hypothetical protein [Hydrogenophaga sp.]
PWPASPALPRAGVVVGVAGVFWAVGAVVGLGSRLAWSLRPTLGGPERH